MFDLLWIGLAFGTGLLVHLVRLPPLVGYLIAGFVLSQIGVETGDTLTELSELGITLLLFTIGLKLRLRTLATRHVLGVASLHMALFTLLAAALVAALAWLGIGAVAGVDAPRSLLYGFALSYSSTVFAAKFLEARGEMATSYGRATIGILIIQDLAAVGFIAVSVGQLPSAWALLLIPALLPLRWLLGVLLEQVRHGELLVLFGLTVAVAGVELFELLQVKGDLGALAFGLLLAHHRKADELSKAMLGFKNLFLVGFFLTVGLGGLPSWADVGIALVLVAALPLKSFLYFLLMTRFGMRARSGLLASIGLLNYSEFGLIVAAVGTEMGWLDAPAMSLLATTVAISFVVASPVNEKALGLYERLRHHLRRFEVPTRLPEEREIQPGPAAALVFGMGRVGVGAYDRLAEERLGRVVGIESAADVVARHQERGRDVVLGSGTDLDFWGRLSLDVDVLRLVVLTMPTTEENTFAAIELRRRGFDGRISAIAKFVDDEKILTNAGVDHAFNIYRGAGAGLAEDATRELYTDSDEAEG